ncbi:MAG: T9SS type A sorting domain-containing protein [Parafilimonas sp.]
MKSIYIFFTLIGISISSFCQVGKLNQSFGDTGTVLTGYNNTQLQSFSSAMQTDDKTVVVGSSDSLSTIGFLVLRYLPGGSLDNSFGINGKVIVDFGYDLQVAFGVVMQSDGKIVVTGYGASGLFDPEYGILTVRLKTNGSLDSTFGTNGKVVTDLGKAEFAYALCLQSDGKIVLSGNYDNVNLLLVRLKTNGSLDSTFGKNGKVINTQIGNMAFGRSVLVQPDGKIIVGGDRSGSTPTCLVTRYKTNGTLDSSFGTNGIVNTKLTNYGDQFLKVVLQQDGRIIGVGRTGLFSGNDNDNNIIAVRYKSNGVLDSTYGAFGIQTINFPGASSAAQAAILETDGKLLITGNVTDSNANFVLLRLKTDGRLDSSFGTNGSTITDFNLNDFAYSIVLQGGDSSIIVAGYSQSISSGDTVDVSLAAYNQSGVRQMIVTKIKHWLQHHNGIQWNNVTNVNSYVVQRSYDGIHFNSIARINAGNNSNYTYADPAPLSGANYYRLQTTSVNGAVNYSNVIAVSNNDIKISPNPATNSLQIQGLSSSQKIKLTVVDFTGNVAISQQLKANSNSSYNLNIASLKQGNYLLKIETNGDVITKKFVKE